jgi:hypothetical protein
MSDRQAVLAAFTSALKSTDAKALLLAAEAAIQGQPPGSQSGPPAINAACASVGALIGYPMNNYDNQTQNPFRSTVSDYMQTLRPIAQAGYYNFYL